MDQIEFNIFDKTVMSNDEVNQALLIVLDCIYKIYGPRTLYEQWS